MAIETAKESSDMLPPLRAVLGALFVLIENYDVSPPDTSRPLTADRILQRTTANVEQIKDIEERIQSLGEMLRSPIGDWDAEENARRTALRRFMFLLQETLKHLSLIGRLQEVGWGCCQTQATIRAKRACEVPEER